MPKRSSRKMLNCAKLLRRNMTPEERKLWYTFLRSYPAKFYKQRIIGPYIVDFYCDKAKLAVEIDGTQHYLENGEINDAKRLEFLRGLGLKIICFSNREVNLEFESVKAAIENEVKVYD